VRAVALLILCASIIRSTYWHMNATLIVEVWIRNLLSIKSRRVRKRRDLKELLPYHRRVWTIFHTHTYTFYFSSKFCYLLVQNFFVSKDFFSTRKVSCRFFQFPRFLSRCWIKQHFYGRLWKLSGKLYRWYTRWAIVGIHAAST